MELAQMHGKKVMEDVSKKFCQVFGFACLKDLLVNYNT